MIVPRRTRFSRQVAADFLIYFGCWTLLGLFFATQNMLAYGYGGRPITFAQALELGLTEWYLWGIFALPILWFSRKLAVSGRFRWVAIGIHFVSSIVVAAIKMNLDLAVIRLITGAPPRSFSMLKLHVNVITYWVILGISEAIKYYRMYRDRELTAARLQSELVQAQLQALKTQIHPHFLFNTLHAISEMMHEDIEAADKTIAGLSELLRITLASAATQEVPLRDEMEFLGQYLDIQRTRFGDRLQVVLRIPPELLEIPVPNLILQPIVENAIQYAVAPRAAGGRIEISAAERNGSIVLKVRDNGPGLSGQAVSAHGLGLSNTRERLSCLYGQAARLELRDLPEGGVEAIVTIPTLHGSTALNDHGLK